MHKPTILKWITFFVVILIFSKNTLARQITDMAGRKVTIPDKINSVLPYDNKTNVMLFSVAADLMTAKARSMESPYLKYISNDFLKLKEVDSKNAEEVLKLHPDIIVVVSFTNDRGSLSRYTEFSKQVNIPLVIVDIELMNLDKSYEFLGELLGRQEQVKPYVRFIQQVYANVKANKESKTLKINAYLANDNNGQRTAPAGSSHAQLFDELGINNVAKTSLDANGFAIVSMEQVLAWSPDYIFCMGKGENSPYRTILKSSLWRSLPATKNNHVYYVPSEPYLWFDMPPSINRILGLIWFNQLFYNQSLSATQETITEFYRLFYKYNLTEKEYQGLFKWQ